MAKTIVIDPVTRIEGHLSIRVDVSGNRVTAAYSAGEMFRGFETILRGRDPLDAQHITQRICGVCPISHATAAVLAQDTAYGLTPPANGRIARNLVLAANYIQSHILHFYHLSALDFIDIAAVSRYQGRDDGLNALRDWVRHQLSSRTLFPAAPFLPRYRSAYAGDTTLNMTAIKHYLDALDMRAVAHQAAALFGGKMPHASTFVPGGITERITLERIAAFRTRLTRLRRFIDECYLPDVLAVAGAFPHYFDTGRGCGNFLAYGVFPEADGGTDPYLPAGVLVNGQLQPFDAGKITEDVRHSWFSSGSGLTPEAGRTTPAPDKEGAYSWLKAPRYAGQVMEVGPLARMLVAYHHGHPDVRPLINRILSRTGKRAAQLPSVLGRHAARALECKLVADRCASWLEALVPDQPATRPFIPPPGGEGVGLTEAPRGALGHWLKVDNHHIAHYQCVVPTTWNCSPRDDQGVPGAVEQALAGVHIADPSNPIEAMRVVRSLDPCIACAVH